MNFLLRIPHLSLSRSWQFSDKLTSFLLFILKYLSLHSRLFKNFKSMFVILWKEKNVDLLYLGHIHVKMGVIKFQKRGAVNLSQIWLINMRLLVLIKYFPDFEWRSIFALDSDQQVLPMVWFFNEIHVYQFQGTYFVKVSLHTGQKGSGRNLGCAETKIQVQM